MEVYPGVHNRNSWKVAVLPHEQHPGPEVAPGDVPLDGGPLAPRQWSTGRLLSAVTRRIEREWNARLAHWGLNHASLPVLYLLAGGPRSQRELALSSGVTEQTMSRILARLERQEYVARRTHEADRRRHEVHLTDAGRLALLEAGDPAIAEAMSVRGLTEDQIAALRHLLIDMLAVDPTVGRSLSELMDADLECSDEDLDDRGGVARG